MLDILLIESNHEYIESLFNGLSNSLYNKYRISTICTNSDKINYYILNSKNDIILIDINMPNFNIFELLNTIKNKDIRRKIITISKSTDSEVRISNKDNLHGPYDIEELVKYLDNLYSLKNSKRKVRDIETLLNIFSFNTSNVGYQYIIDILNYCIEMNYKHIPMIKNIYAEIAKRNEIPDPSNVGWNVEKALNTMKRNTSPKVMEKYFSYPPSPKNFLDFILNFYYKLVEKQM